MDCRHLQRVELLACAGFAGVLLVFLFFYATVPITDADFGWHLKSGEMMFQNGGLLQSDPFTFTDDGKTSTRESLILKGYWLWQLTAYGFYALLGIDGIFLLNFLTLLAMVAVVSLQMRRQKVNYALAILLITLGFFLIRHIYFLERPQIVSFLFAAILLGFIARVREGGRLGWTLPLVMMVWSNLHGGFVVGDLILLCFAFGAVIEYRHDLSRMRHLLCWVGIGIAASFLNPSGVLVVSELFSFYNSSLMNVSEFQSTWLVFSQGKKILLILWILIALYCFGVLWSRRIFWPEITVAIFLAYFSVAYLRNVAFFAVAMLPSIGFYLQQGGELRPWRNAPPWKYLIVFMAVVSLLWRSGVDHQIGSKADISSTFPVESTRFIMSSGLQGNMYNNYNFGGFQIWQLYPQNLVFIDTRCMDAAVLNDWIQIGGASSADIGGRKVVDVLLDRYEVDSIVQPHVYKDNGRLTPLMKYLLVKSEWIPIYIDQQGYILVRNSPKNAAVIDRYRMDKDDFNNKMIGFLKVLCNARPKELANHVALAEMLIFVGRYDEAELRLLIISQLQPDNRYLPALRSQLSVLKNVKRL